MESSILLEASAWRAKYIEETASPASSPRTAVVVGATSGIGQAISYRLAEQGWSIVAVGRNREGRPESTVKALNEFSPQKDSDNEPSHVFVACDCFSLKNVRAAAREILVKNKTIDALILTQGMATTQGFTKTPEGNDEKMTLHYFSRMAFARMLLPALKQSTMSRGSVVLSVLSGGVHSPYKKYQEDFSLENNYSILNAADAAGFYNDLGLDHLAKENPETNFVHASPGFVNTNWGTELNPFLRVIVRCIQLFGKKASDCAEFMVGPTVFASAYDDDLPSNSSPNGVIIMDENGQSAKVTTAHTKEAVGAVWEKTVSVLGLLEHFFDVKE